MTTRQEPDPAPRRVEAVLFDLDGTLLDSIPLILDSFVHTYRVSGLPVPAREDLVRVLGIPLWVVFGEIVEDETRVQEMIAVYREFNLAHHDARVRAFPGVGEMVRGVRALGCRTAIVTSKNRDGTVRGLELAALDRDIEVIVSCEDVTRPKPDREPVDRALDRLGVDASVAMFVGDSPHDLQSGRAAGVRTAAVLWGPFGRESLAQESPDLWLERPADLLSTVSGDRRRP